VRAAADYPVEPVYNIEVEGEHCYRVGQQGILVHNTSAPANCQSTQRNRMYDTLQNVQLSNGQQGGRAAGAQAYLHRSFCCGGSNFFTGYPSWWNLLPAGTTWIRSHLIGGQLTGQAGMEFRNLVPLYARANNPIMRACETYVARLVDECCHCVNY